ncbi:MAG: Transrane secretion effector [Actinomycetota bacterium]
MTKTEAQPGATARSGPGLSVIQQLRPTPRIFVLSGVMLLTAVNIAARETVRIDYATDSVGSEAGVGLVAAVWAIALAVVSPWGGRLADARRAGNILTLTMMVAASSHLLTAWVLSQGTMPVPYLVVTTAVEGSNFGLLVPALLKVQAAMVRPDARGAAEILNILRLGIGGVIGALLGAAASSPVVVNFIGGLVVTAVGAIIFVLVRPVVMPAQRAGLASWSEVRAQLRVVPWIRPTIVADLVLTFVLPTQLIALVVVDRGADDVKTVALVSSLLGVLTGRLLLTGSGLRGDLRRRVLVPTIAFAALAGIGAVSLIDDWVLGHPPLLAILVFAASTAMTRAQGVPVALLQQQLPDEVRGAVSGVMNAARYLLVAGAVAILAAVTVRFSAVQSAALISILSVIGISFTRGFSGLRFRD